MIGRRIQELRRRLIAARIAAAYLASPIARRYFTGFTGTAGSVLVTQKSAVLFTDFRYTERASEETPDDVTVEETRSVLEALKKSLHGVKKLGIEDQELTVLRHSVFTKRLKGIKLVGLGSMVEEIRAIKDEAEIALLKQAIAATDKTYQEAVRWLKSMKRAKRLPTEEAVAWKIRDVIHTRRLGELAFETIVATGPHSARPHHEPTARRLKLGDALVIDMGVMVRGYHADMTRTVFLGEPSAKLKIMYRTTLQAQQAAIRYLKQGGRSAHQADTVARQVIDKKFPGSFGHALGHGVGLEIHEYPTLSPKSPHRLKPGMVFSVEPGIYLPGQAGIRIEDLVLLKKDGCEVLSKSPRSLVVL